MIEPSLLSLQFQDDENNASEIVNAFFEREKARRITHVSSFVSQRQRNERSGTGIVGISNKTIAEAETN